MYISLSDMERMKLDCRARISAARRSNKLSVSQQKHQREYKVPDKQAQRDKAVVNVQNHRARKAGQIGVVTYEEWSAMLSKYDRKCVKCRSGNRICMDHIRGLAQGGEHSIKNIQPLCIRCNNAKGSQVIDWRF